MRPATIVVLGNDAFLAARPASPVQLTHAALAAGFDAAVPASWGDELVAAACARELAGPGASPSVFCACPHVAQRLLTTGAELAPFLVSLVSPPVALSRHLRSFYETGLVRLTYVGRCPGAHGAYDAIVHPDEFLRLLADRDIHADAQPDAFEAVVPPDRRRYFSLPGGLPALTALRSAGVPHGIVELTGGDFAADLAQHLLSGVPLLIDGAAQLGCACAGATSECARDARTDLMAHEPPRAFAPVIDLPEELRLTAELPRAARDVADVVAAIARGTAGGAPAARPVVEAAPVLPARLPAEQVVDRGVSLAADAHAVPPRRRSPATGVPVVRPPAGFTPIARANDGRVLPRAYVARRRGGTRPALDDDAGSRDG